MASPPLQRKIITPPYTTVTVLGAFDLVSSSPLTVDLLTQSSVLGTQSQVQSVWCDASASPSRITIRNPSTRQVAYWPAGHVGWLNLFLRDDMRLVLSANRSVTVDLAVSSDLIPPSIFDGGLIAPLASDQSEWHEQLATSVPVDLLGPSVEGVLKARSRIGYDIYNDSDRQMYVLEDDDTTPDVGPLKMSYALQPGGFRACDRAYVDVVRAVWPVGAAGRAHITAFYREF